MKKLILLLFLSFSITTFSQLESTKIIKKSGNLEAYLNEYLSSIPTAKANDDFKNTYYYDLVFWKLALRTLIRENNINSAFRFYLSQFHYYNLIEYTDTSHSSNNTYYILQEKTREDSDGNIVRLKNWGIYVIAKNPLRENLILQAPHSKYDSNTGKQAIYCFTRLKAKALFLNGAHRCNSTEASSCSGLTRVCSPGTSQAYRVSDLAHSAESIFQGATEVLNDENDNSVFVQLHGFGKKSTDPYVILSNGTRTTPTTDKLLEFKDALYQEDDSLTFKIAHIDTSWTRLVGFTNTQGRYINNSANACTVAATSSQGRFIHVEQSRTKLRSDSTGWNKVYNALANTFTANSSRPDSLEDFVSNNNLNDDTAVYTIHDLSGKLILAPTTSNTKEIATIMNSYTRGIYLVKIQNKDNVIYRKILKR